MPPRVAKIVALTGAPETPLLCAMEVSFMSYGEQIARKARRVAKALSQRRVPFDDYCGFARDVGAQLADLDNARKRNSPCIFVAEYLAFGILDRIQQIRGETGERITTQEREKREAIRDLLRLVTIDGKPVERP
jgi:hypothetical protein